MLEYGEKDSTPYSLFTLVLIALFSWTFLIRGNVFTHLYESSESFSTSFLPDSLIIVWRMFCFLFGLSAIVYMFRMKTGTMIVIDHETRKEVTLHPIGIKKFVTFSSWTLLCNAIYFLLAMVSSLAIYSTFSVPKWLYITQILFFATALGSAFLTSTIVRYIILPGEVRARRNHERQFYFHNQMMHNFATIFLAVEIILFQPELQPHFAVFGLIFGSLYALFAYPFAYFGGGYYVYSFIDPRLKYAPLLVSGLAGIISIFYLGLWILSLLMSYNSIIGTLVAVLWVSLIVQFRPEPFEPKDEI